ncbi:hypothetical protein ONZ45_g15885 [Pleurotus djamor]|nr:hypothetical protein ONZ45_g15885 [Pleurotus djamor]
MASEIPLSFAQTVAAISEFIEVAIHTTLYARQVYPPDLFIRRKKYDTPVFQSRHPALNEYISGAVKAIHEELLLGAVDKIVVIIKNRDQIALERFIFSIQQMIEVESYDKETQVDGAMTPKSLGQYFRSFLIKLSMIESQLGQLDVDDDDISFAVALELNDNKAPSASQGANPPPWIPADTQHTTAGTDENSELHLIRAVNTGVINLSLAVQESTEKLSAGRPPPDPKGKARGSP